MFGSLKSLKACTAHISHSLICHEIRNKVEVNAPRLSIVGLFGFRKSVRLVASVVMNRLGSFRK